MNALDRLKDEIPDGLIWPMIISGTAFYLIADVVARVLFSLIVGFLNVGIGLTGFLIYSALLAAGVGAGAGYWTGWRTGFMGRWHGGLAAFLGGTAQLVLALVFGLFGAISGLAVTFMVGLGALIISTAAGALAGHIAVERGHTR